MNELEYSDEDRCEGALIAVRVVLAKAELYRMSHPGMREIDDEPALDGEPEEATVQDDGSVLLEYDGPVSYSYEPRKSRVIRYVEHGGFPRIALLERRRLPRRESDGARRPDPQLSPVHVCAHCGQGFTGRRRPFCTSRCRSRAFRRRHAGLPEHALTDGGRRGRLPLGALTRTELTLAAGRMSERVLGRRLPPD